MYVLGLERKIGQNRSWIQDKGNPGNQMWTFRCYLVGRKKSPGISAQRDQIGV